MSGNSKASAVVLSAAVTLGVGALASYLFYNYYYSKKYKGNYDISIADICWNTNGNVMILLSCFCTWGPW